MKKNIQLKTLTKKDVESLAASYRGRRHVVSFYLGIRADRNFLAAANSALSEAEKASEADKKIGDDEKVRLRTIFKKIESELRTTKLPDRTRSFVAFADSPDNLQMFKLPVYVPSKLVVEKGLYVHPFVKEKQRYPHYGVVFLERDRARIFELFWGEVENETEELRSEVPQRMNAARATWKGLEERKIQNHIEVHIDRHLKKVAQRAEVFMEKNKLPYLIIGSRRELIERFCEFLPQNIRQKIIGSFFARSDQNLQSIREKSSQVVDECESRMEAETVQRLLAGNSKKDKGAVLGTDAVLRALGDYKVRTLVVGSRYMKPGFYCLQCHRVGLRKGKCTVCGRKLQQAEDIADKLIELAMLQKAKILHFLDSHEDFDSFGVGALLK